jgi:hypothetical protein
VAQGVTTLDIALIRQQVLNIKPLDSPYKLLAGDVNGSGSVTTLDIALIRQVILGITNKFPGGLWRFVRSDYVFANPQASWSAQGARNYQNLAAGANGQDFIAVKLGDVNNSWSNWPAAAIGKRQRRPRWAIRRCCN